jgi:structural maintenance of chromosomes protein 5
VHFSHRVRCRDKWNERQQEYKKLEQDAMKIQAEFTAIKQKLRQAKDLATSEAPLEDANGNPLPLKEKLEDLEVTTLAEVEAALEDAQQVLDTIQANDGVFRQYQKLESEIAEVEAHLKQLSSGKESRLSIIEEKSKPWETALTNHVAKINAKFSFYMSEMQCTGEVRLKKGSVDEVLGENGALSNFRDWGIEILVSYRNGAKAQILSAERHSGGERSVATILYLMAIQDLMCSPFRCVDEINQGLDERNERLVFKRIVANSTGKPKNNNPFNHSGQYFLITPKLLPNMTDMENEAVTIQTVFNGTSSIVVCTCIGRSSHSAALLYSRITMFFKSNRLEY